MRRTTRTPRRSGARWKSMWMRLTSRMETIPQVQLMILVSLSRGFLSLCRAHSFRPSLLFDLFPRGGHTDSPADDYYLNDASLKELLRLRKDALVRLYTSAGLLDDFDALTKNELADAIISARDDIVDLPPSSPSGCTSSDGLSDDGNFGGGEETDVNHRFRPAATNGLRRRVTVHNVVSQPTRLRPGRTISLGQLDRDQFDTKVNTTIAKYNNLGLR